MIAHILRGQYPGKNRGRTREETVGGGGGRGGRWVRGSCENAPRLNTCKNALHEILSMIVSQKLDYDAGCAVPREDQRRRLNPHIRLISKATPLKLFLDSRYLVFRE